MVCFIHEGEKMINTQYNALPSYCVLTRSNVSRFAIVLFVALLVLWQGVVFGTVPNTFYMGGPSTITADVADGASETSGSLMVYSGVNEIIKIGGGTWIINGGYVNTDLPTAPAIKLKEGTIDIRYNSSGNSSVSGYLTMDAGTTIISDITEHLRRNNQYSVSNVMLNLTGSGNIVINEGKSFGVKMISGQHTEFSGAISGENVTFAVYCHDDSDSSFTLSGSNSFTGELLVRRGVRLILTDDAIASIASVKIDDATNSTLEYNVKSGTKRLDLTDGKVIKGCQVGSSLSYEGNYGKIEKTGSGTLPINTETNESIKVERFAIVSGRVDYQGYFDSFVRSGIDIQDGAVFSSGLSDSNTIGNAILGSAITLAFEAAALFEFNSYSDEPDSRLFDAIAIDKNSRSDSVLFKQQSDSFIELALSSETEKWAEKDAKYLLISDERIDSDPGDSQILNDDCIYRMANHKDIFQF